jgi:ribulose 1,5-bisphosphate synthetase/thiazole synthase
VKGGFQIPSESIFRDVLIRVEPEQLDLAVQQWHEVHGQDDESLAIDGKTMKNAIDKAGRQTHIMSAIGHQSKVCYTQKKSVLCP